jgi:hypothetical protein
MKTIRDLSGLEQTALLQSVGVKVGSFFQHESAPKPGMLYSFA